MANVTAPIKQSLAVDVGKGNGVDPVVTCNGAKVLECLCEDDIW